MSDGSGRAYLAAGGGVSAAFGSMLCCTGPIVLAAAGVSGAGLATIAPFRPLFVVLAFVSLWGGFQALDRMSKPAVPIEDGEQGACEPGKPCADPSTTRRMRNVLWAATALTVVFATSPLWDDLFF